MTILWPSRACATPSSQAVSAKTSKTVTIGAYPRRIIPLRRLCPIEASFISPFLPFFHSHLVIYLVFLSADNESASPHYIATGLALSPVVNLPWNSSELPRWARPFFLVIDRSKNYFLFFRRHGETSRCRRG